MQLEEAKPSEQGGFNPSEIEKLKTLLRSLEKPSGICSLAHPGQFPISIGLKVSDRTSFASSWVVNLGATNHRPHLSQKFRTYTPCPSNQRVAIADGSSTTIAGIEDVQISPSFRLKDVHHLQNCLPIFFLYNHNLLDSCCNVIFRPTHCVFQDQDLGKTIGRAKEWDRLYQFETPSSPNIAKSNIS